MDCHATLAMTEVASFCLCEDVTIRGKPCINKYQDLERITLGGVFAPKNRQQNTVRYSLAVFCLFNILYSTFSAYDICLEMNPAIFIM